MLPSIVITFNGHSNGMMCARRFPVKSTNFTPRSDLLSDTQARFKPAPQEWSIKEVIGHLNDVERVFSYRLLRISRNDATPLPGFEQEDYVRAAGFDNYPLSDLVA